MWEPSVRCLSLAIAPHIDRYLYVILLVRIEKVVELGGKEMQLTAGAISEVLVVNGGVNLCCRHSSSLSSSNLVILKVSITSCFCHSFILIVVFIVAVGGCRDGLRIGILVALSGKREEKED